MAELEARWRELGEFIRDQRHTGHLSLRKLSEMAGISNPYLSQIERGLRKPSAEILQQIARALEISSETLYVRAGILDAHESDTDLVTEIRRDPWLNEDQKKTLVQIYQSFRAERRAAGIGPTVEDADGAGEGDEDGDGEVTGLAEGSLDGEDPADQESEAFAGRS
jgi:transcriptional regulator with XRE-family HTH domain